jgi:membrane protein implicated in regulation of membrane protease activity
MEEATPLIQEEKKCCLTLVGITQFIGGLAGFTIALTLVFMYILAPLIAACGWRSFWSWWWYFFIPLGASPLLYLCTPETYRRCRRTKSTYGSV